jgi:hypothetical protein
MNRKLTSLLVMSIALPWAAHARAQYPHHQPAAPYAGQPGLIYIEQKAEAAPAPKVVPGSAAPCMTTICVVEPKKNTKVVYTSRCKDYCVPSCSLFGGDCCACCEKRTKNVLIKKVVPDCDTTQCVLKEVPAECAPCPPCPR